MRRSSSSLASSSTSSEPLSIRVSGCRLMGAPKGGRLESWIPRHSIVGRIVHPLFEERKTLAGRMSWIGLGLLVAFLVVALGANVLAPFDPILPTDAIHVPPWTVATVPRYKTYPVWTANWSAPTER